MNEFLCWLMGIGVGVLFTGIIIGAIHDADTCAHKFGIRTQEYALCRFQEQYPVKP